MRVNWAVRPEGYVYWHQKKQFLMDSDTYTNWTMFVVESGRFHYRIGTLEGEAGPGQIVVCPPDLPFTRRTLTPLNFHFIRFVWELEPDEKEASLLSGALTIADTERLATTFRYLRGIGEGWRDPDQSAYYRLRHLVSDIWQLVQLELEREQSLALEEKVPVEDSPDMRYAYHWLQQHAFEPFVMRELSDALGIRPVQLTRRFRQAYRTTPSSFVTGLRLGRACRLLEESTLPLEEIAQRCGYENGFYLSRVFRSKKGITPSEYRRLHRV